jgi:molybdopterin molybdotransferase
MLSIEEALKLVEEHSRPLAPRRIPLQAAAGLVLAEDVTSEVNSPPYDKALMDGYAVRSIDREPERQVLEEITAGAVPHFPVTPGAASRIMTGAPLPEGADAVVVVEQTRLVGDSVVRLDQVDPPAGQHVLHLGTSVRAGDVVLCKGVELRPIEIAILAEVGHGMVTAWPHPRVAVLPTGNELVQPGERVGRGQISNSNGPMLVAAAARVGADAIELGIARDDRDELKTWIEQGLAADVLMLSGGVSAGKFDLVPAVLAELGVELVFHKVALRPGKPLWFGVKHENDRRALVFGLPGNPVSSLVCFELFVRPAIAALGGRGFQDPPSVRACLSHAYEYRGGRASCLPARVTVASKSSAVGSHQLPLGEPLFAAQAGELVVEILPWHGSADIATLARANGLARFSAEPQRFEPGAELDVLLL